MCLAKAILQDYDRWNLDSTDSLEKLAACHQGNTVFCCRQYVPLCSNRFWLLLLLLLRSLVGTVCGNCMHFLTSSLEVMFHGAAESEREFLLAKHWIESEHPGQLLD